MTRTRDGPGANPRAAQLVCSTQNRNRQDSSGSLRRERSLTSGTVPGSTSRRRKARAEARAIAAELVPKGDRFVVDAEPMFLDFIDGDIE